MRYISLLILVLTMMVPSIKAQDSYLLLIQYKGGSENVLVDLPATAKLNPKDNSVVATPYGYNLRLQGHRIANSRLVTYALIGIDTTTKRK